MAFTAQVLKYRLLMFGRTGAENCGRRCRRLPEFEATAVATCREMCLPSNHHWSQAVVKPAKRQRDVDSEILAVNARFNQNCPAESSP